MKTEILIQKAREAREHAYAPYSGFQVGACVATKDGNYISGANVENASYGATSCAERNALFAAYAKGYRKQDIEAIAITAASERICTPCGICRQVFAELLAEDVPVFLSNGKETVCTNTKELLPDQFDGSFLEAKG